jgi:hypothetical protein
MMNVIQHNAAFSGVTRFVRHGHGRRRATHKTTLFIRALLNSLFDGKFICPRPANSMNFRHFLWRAVAG